MVTVVALFYCCNGLIVVYVCMDDYHTSVVWMVYTAIILLSHLRRIMLRISC